MYVALLQPRLSLVVHAKIGKLSVRNITSEFYFLMNWQKHSCYEWADDDFPPQFRTVFRSLIQTLWSFLWLHHIALLTGCRSVHRNIQIDIAPLTFKVCCKNPPAPPPPPPTTARPVNAIADRNCFTPEGLPGECVGLYSCPRIVTLLSNKPVPRENLDFVRFSK